MPRLSPLPKPAFPSPRQFEPKSELRRSGTRAGRRRSQTINERQPYDDMRKVALLARENIARHKRLLSETDQLLRGPRDLIGRTQELIRENQHLKRLAKVTCRGLEADRSISSKIFWKTRRTPIMPAPSSMAGP
jgi:hypothetical protein